MSAEMSLSIDAPEAYLNRELSWLDFARRVLALAEDSRQPLLERVKFAGIMGMIHDEFAMKRIGGLRRQLDNRTPETGADGMTPSQTLRACREELAAQARRVERLVQMELRPQLAAAGIPIHDLAELDPTEQAALSRYFQDTVEPILTPLAVDAAHPFPFVSNLGLNLAVLVEEEGRPRGRFVRIKVPANRPRWVPVPAAAGWVPLEQVMAANLDRLFPRAAGVRCHYFRVTRGAKDDPWTDLDEDAERALTPGGLIGRVTAELTARKFAGVVRVQASADLPVDLQTWLTTQLHADPEDLQLAEGLLGMADLMRLPVEGHPELRDPPHEPVSHPRLRHLDPGDPAAIFQEIRRGDLLVHLPYHSFETSILRFIQSAAVDPRVLALKLTIYRTSSHSPIIQALADAARRGKQVRGAGGDHGAVRRGPQHRLGPRTGAGWCPCRLRGGAVEDPRQAGPGRSRGTGRTPAVRARRHRKLPHRHGAVVRGFGGAHLRCHPDRRGRGAVQRADRGLIPFPYRFNFPKADRIKG